MCLCQHVLINASAALEISGGGSVAAASHFGNSLVSWDCSFGTNGSAVCQVFEKVEVVLLKT